MLLWDRENVCKVRCGKLIVVVVSDDYFCFDVVLDFFFLRNCT